MEPRQMLAATVSISDAVVVEGDPGDTVQLVFNVTLDNAVDTDVTFDYQTQDGTAIAGQDYDTATSTLTISAGDTSSQITVDVTEELLVESDETLTLLADNLQADGRDVMLAGSGTQGGGEWIQLGANIDGANDFFGSSLATSDDGNTIVVGARFNDSNGTDSGYARVYRFDTGTETWSQLGGDILGEAADDRSGYSVDMSADGNTVIIGARLNDGNGHDAGHARIYRYNGSSWIQLGLDIEGEAIDDQSGFSVTMSADGTTVAIGAPANDGTANWAGHVRVYRFSAGSWSPLGSDIDGEAAFDQSGPVAISADGNTIAIGAPFNDDNGNNSGHVRVYGFIGGSWTQLGADIDGEAAEDRSGYSVALSADGSRVVIGGYLNDDNGSNSGHVRIFELVGTGWSQLGSDIDGEAAEDVFGYSVAISDDGNSIVIGAPTNDDNGNNAGQASVYRLVGTSWMQVGADIDGEFVGERSGGAVTISADGNTVVIGAAYQTIDRARVYRFSPPAVTATGTIINDDSATVTISDATVVEGEPGDTVQLVFNVMMDNPVDTDVMFDYQTQDGSAIGGQDYNTVSSSLTILAGDTSGQITVEVTEELLVESDETLTLLANNLQADGRDVTLVGTGTQGGVGWGQLGGDIDGEAAGDNSGWSVATSDDGNTVIIGANRNDVSGTNSGHARIYRFDGSAWNQLGGDIDGEAAGDQAGNSVAMSADGNTVIIGARYNDDSGTNSGHVRIYRFDGSTWNQLGGDIDGETVGDQTGNSVAMSDDGNTVVIGATGSDGNGIPYSGHARIYRFDGSTWNQLGSNIDGEAAFDFSGWSVAMSADGNTVVVGAVDNGGNGSQAGHARIYQFDGSAWNQLGGDIDGEASVDNSGYSVSMSADGSTVVIGALLNDGNGADSGHARIYRFDGSVWSQLGDDIDGEAAGDHAGYSVSMSADGNTVVIGALLNDGNGADSGHARIYHFDGSTWNQVGADIDGEAGDDNSNWSAAISADGNTVIIGAPLNDGNGANGGHARIYRLAPADVTATGTILNDDSAQFTISSQSGDEDDGPLSFTVTISNPVDVATSVNVSTSDGTALISDNDYAQILGQTLNFAAGVTTQTFDVTPTSDNKVELNETFDVSLSGLVDGGRSVTASSLAGTGTILNDDILSAQSFNLDENQSSVGTIVASDLDLPDNTLSFSITGNGPDDAKFAITAGGVLSFIAPPDFESPTDLGGTAGDNVYRVEVEVEDGAGETATATMSVNVLNLASITGVVFVDVNQNGLFEANEPGIDGVVVELLDELGAPVLDDTNSPITATTSDGGFYLFEDLEQATYQLHEIQPTGVDDGAEILGTILSSVSGSVVANDTMQMTLDRDDATDYVFAELGQDVTSGDTATIGFWQNKHGQALINEGGPNLANWLGTNFTNIFGNVFDSTNVAHFYKEQLFKQKAVKGSGPAKVDAQFMATALATYFTSSNLAGTVAASYGFNVTETGIGTTVVNVGSSGAAFDVDDGMELTIMQLLLATNNMTANDGDATSIYDTNGDGIIDSTEAALRDMANSIYSMINEEGDI